MATLESRISALDTLLRNNITGVTSYYDFEPPYQHMNGPVALTLSWAETTPDYWRIRIRVYCFAGSDVEKASELVRSIPVLVDAKLTNPYGPSSWVSDLTEEQDAYFAECILDVGREDY